MVGDIQISMRPAIATYIAVECLAERPIHLRWAWSAMQNHRYLKENDMKIYCRSGLVCAIHSDDQDISPHVYDAVQPDDSVDGRLRNRGSWAAFD